MATRMVWDLWVPFASICMMFAMLVAVGVSEPSWTYVHSDTPASSPNTGTGDGSSTAAEFSPHFLTTTLFAFLAFLLPFCLSFLC